MQSPVETALPEPRNVKLSPAAAGQVGLSKFNYKSDFYEVE